jgi:uncharacterized membrane protein YozB (DUF420 family)
MTIQDLPMVNACLNGSSALLLAVGGWLIHRGHREAHRRCMVAALGSSALFLASYLYYHSQVGTTRFENPAGFRPYYLALLLSHTVLAVVIVPLIFVTFFHALKGRFEKHKALARWTFPLWMYVSVTGVVIYLLLYQVFPQKGPEGSKGQPPAWRI